MKVEYSFNRHNPIMVIKGSEFIKAMEDKEEEELLYIAVDGFCAKYDAITHFNEEINNIIRQRISKTDEVIYEMIEGTYDRMWCEIWIRKGTRTISIVESDDNGRNFMLNRNINKDEE